MGDLDFQIIWENEIEFNYENLSIYFNVTRNSWRAEHYNEDMYENIIMINESELPIMLFDEFLLTKEIFNDLKSSIEEDNNDKD